MEFKNYKRKGLSEMRPYVQGEALEGVSISGADVTGGSPKIGDMIARNPKNHDDMWLVAAKYFEDNLELADEGDFIDKLLKKDSEVSSNCEELQGFINTNIMYKALELNAQILLQEQLVVMKDYSEILGKRLKLLRSNE